MGYFGNVSTTVLNAYDVGMRGQAKDNVDREVETSIGGNTVKYHGNRRGVGNPMVMLIESFVVHTIFKVARCDYYGNVCLLNENAQLVSENFTISN